MTETCPLCNKELVPAAANDQLRCDTKSCVLYAHPQKTVREVREKFRAAELRGFEMARDKAINIVSSGFDSHTANEWILLNVRAMKMDGEQ